VTIHGNVTSIEDSAFSYCTRLTSVTIPLTSPPLAPLRSKAAPV